MIEIMTMKLKEKEIKNELNCVFIRTNPDAANFNISELNNQIFISNSIKRKKCSKESD